MHLNRTMDGRKCFIYLPNHKKHEVTVSAKQTGKDLFDSVVSEFKIRERHYFGLKFKTTGEHYAWIQDDKKVLDHDNELKATSRPLEFTFSVKFYEDSITVHKQPSTVELIFLNARNLIYQGEINVSSELSFQLAALVLQAIHGDYASEEEASTHFQQLPCLPSKVVEDFSSMEHCEQEILAVYRGLQGLTRGKAILSYLTKAETLANYGVHYYRVKDKARIPWWLGISNKGIYQYNFHDKVKPDLIFHWRHLENLYFREKKFSVEVCSGHRRALSAGLSSQAPQQKKNAGNNPQVPKTYAWYGSPALIKSIWIMAIAQHQFYWDRKQSHKSHKTKSHNKNNTDNLIAALDKNSNSLLMPLQKHGDMQRRNVKNAEATVRKGHKEQPPEIVALKRKMADDLRKRKLDLEDRLYDKVQELKEICRQEYDITEKLPIEYLRYLIPGEEKPTLRRRAGAQFTLRMNNGSASGRTPNGVKSEALRQLEADCELLHKITEAAYKLAHDHTVRGRTRKKRLSSYQKSLKKLQDVENQIDELRKEQGKVPAERASVFITATDLEIMNAMKECSLDDKSERSSLSDGMMLDDETSVSSGAEALSTHSTPALSCRPGSASADVELSDMSIQRSKTPPPTHTKMAWFESPRVKSKHNNYLTPNGSYPVLPSPGSYRSSTSQSSGTPPPQLIAKRDWTESKWEHPRHHNGWKVSSLDSLESIGSRRSIEQGNASDVAGNTKKTHDEQNTNSMRIARPAGSPSRAHKVSLRDRRRKASDSSRRLGTVNPVVEIVEGTIPEDGKDSRTSLTDSGHVSSSENRLQSGTEEEVSMTHRINTIRRDVSDSSLSELSTQSNPAALPSRGHHPKFYPPFLSGQNRAHPLASNGGVFEKNGKPTGAGQGQHSHIRKRSSSFTESGSTVPKVLSRRDNHRTLSRSKSNKSDDTLTRDSSVDILNGDVGKTQGSTGLKTRPTLPNSHSAQDMPAPMFETNLNICKQYLSRSQGQLDNGQQHSQDAGDEATVKTQVEDSAPYKSVVDEQTWANITAYNPASRPGQNMSANNNKLNFGQIYQMSQGRATPDMKRFNSQPDQNQYRDHYGTSNRQQPGNAILKCNSLDSILDGGNKLDPSVNPDTVRNYAADLQQPQKNLFYHPIMNNTHVAPTALENRTVTPVLTAKQQELIMTMCDRDKYNNEAFEEIRGMGWVPSLDEYGSRASVAESLPAKSKKEDIMQLLQHHITHNWRPKRTPSTSSNATMRSKKDLKMRAKMMADMKKEKESQHNHQVYAGNETAESNVETWEGYKKRQNMLWNQTQNAHIQPRNVGQGGNPVKIFRHNPPPPPRHSPQEQIRNQQNYHPQSNTSQANHQQRQVRQGYVNQNGYVVPMPVNGDHRPDPSSYKPQPVPASGHRYQMNPSQPRAASKQRQDQPAGHHNNNMHQQIESYAQEVAEDKPKKAMQARSVSKDGSGDGAQVIQAVTTSPDGYTVSLFTVTKSAPNTPLPQRKGDRNPPTFPISDEEDSDERSEFRNHTDTQNNSPAANRTQNPAAIEKSPNWDKKRPIGDGLSSGTMSKGRSDPNLLATGNEANGDGEKLKSNSQTDMMQAMAIEAARAAQKNLRTSQDNLLSFVRSEGPPALPLTPPNASLRSSRRFRSKTSESTIKSDTAVPSGKARTSSTVSSPKPVRSLSNNPNGKDNEVARMTTGLAASDNGTIYGVKDMRSNVKSPVHRDHEPPCPSPTFQRTLSTPTRLKPFSLSRGVRNQAGNSASKTKITGMYKESIAGEATRTLPPKGPKAPREHVTPSPSPNNAARSPSKKQHSDGRPTYYIGHSGTLPRTPKSRQKVERSGSTSLSSMASSNYVPRHASPVPNQVPAQIPRMQYYHTINRSPRRETFHTLKLKEDLQFKRSLSETWNQQQNLVPVNFPQHHSPDHHPHHHMYHHAGHRGNMPTAEGLRNTEAPRRTASADDLLGPSESMDANPYFIVKQQGTLV